MRAIVQTDFGPPEVLQSADLPELEPGPGEVRVRVAACGVNNLDTQLRRGDFRWRPPLPHILGSEVAGWVDKWGPGTPWLEEGTPVAVSPWVGCGHCEPCRAGHIATCVNTGIIGVRRPGGYAEQVIVPAGGLVPLPEGVDPVSAAALSLAALTAWHMLFTRARLKAGETVLVLAAGSGVGSAAVQLARHAGATVIATAGSDRKLEEAHELGAHATINHYKESIAARVHELTGGRGVDVVVEHTGQATFAESFASLAANGRLVTCGTLTGKDVELDLERLFANQIEIIGSRGGTPGELARLLAVAATGAVRPVIDRVLPGEAAAEAHHLIEERQAFGKIVLTFA